MKFFPITAAGMLLLACRSVQPADAPSSAPSGSSGAVASSGAAKPLAASESPAKTPPPNSVVAEAASEVGPALTEAEFRALHEPDTSVPAPRRGEAVDLGGAQAYLSLPVIGSSGLPGVLIVHEWWGLNANIEHWADRLAAEGYAALAVDLYAGAVAGTREDATRLATAVDEPRALSMLVNAERFLREDPRTRSPRVAAIGWGLGGHYALLHATASKELAGVVVYYGSPVLDSERLAAMQAHLLGIFGTHDKSISPDAVAGFEAALKAVGRQFTLRRYEAEHAFANPNSARYSEELAREAWSETRAFLERVLKTP